MRTGWEGERGKGDQQVTIQTFMGAGISQHAAGPRVPFRELWQRMSSHLSHSTDTSAPATDTLGFPYLRQGCALVRK